MCVNKTYFLGRLTIYWLWIFIGVSAKSNIEGMVNQTSFNKVNAIASYIPPRNPRHRCHVITLLTSQWRHNERDGVSNHRPRDCLLNRLFKAQIIGNIKAPRHWLLCGGFPGYFPHSGSVTRKMFPFDDVIMISWNHTPFWGWCAIAWFNTKSPFKPRLQKFRSSRYHSHATDLYEDNFHTGKTHDYIEPAPMSLTPNRVK